MKHRLACCLALLALCAEASALFTILFDPASLPGGSMYLSGWTELEMSFLTGEGFRHADSGSAPTSPDNGSAYMQFMRVPDQSPLIISNVSSAAFTLFSIDVAEYSALFSTSSVTVVGYKSGGGTVSTNFPIDGVIDGTGPQADFETFSFGTDFQNLTRAEIQANGYALDNVVGELFIIPEPYAGVLLAAGLLAVCGWKRYRTSRSA